MAANWISYVIFVSWIILLLGQTVTASDCEKGMYGSSCNKSCTARHCKSSSDACDIYVGDCGFLRCQEGWVGIDCTKECEAGVRYGFNCERRCSIRHCASPTSSCNVKTGFCDGGCQSGWKGRECIQGCEAGIRYGSNCSKGCLRRHCYNYLRAPCDVQTGDCGSAGCKAGWNGIDCTQECEQNVRYGLNCSMHCQSRYCSSSTASCDVQTGECGNEGCKPGWTGDDCTQICSSGTYGLQCLLKCSDRHCNGDSICSASSGKCDNGCQSGWQGTDCRVCLQKTNYGTNCNKLCNNRNCVNLSSPCDVHTGSCIGGCKGGWEGTDCTQACMKHFKYGPDCNKYCMKRHCLKIFANCDIQTGDCGTEGCQPGWKGDDCTQSCLQNSNYGTNCDKLCSSRNCANSSSPCDVLTGSCIGGCKEGWKGTDCTDIYNSSSCIQDFKYGLECNKYCMKRHCFNRFANCDIQTGDCGTKGCQPGWKGVDCTQSCEQNVSYGPNCNTLCENRHCATSRQTCDVRNGYCGTEGCKPGWEGIDCTRQCDGAYGVNCLLDCSERHCKYVDSPCDSQTGECVGGCKPGWLNQACTKKCDGTYGVNCLFDCSERHCKYVDSPCDSQTGECVGGCKPGWLNQACTKMIQSTSAPQESTVSTQKTSDTGIVVFQTLTVVVSLMVVLLSS